MADFKLSKEERQMLLAAVDLQIASYRRLANRQGQPLNVVDEYKRSLEFATVLRVKVGSL